MKRGILRRRILWTLLMMLIYIMGRNIPIPFVVRETREMSMGFRTFLGDILGGIQAKRTLFTLSIMPWMTASIVVQILQSVADPEGRRTSQRRTQLMAGWLSQGIALFSSISSIQSMKFEQGGEYLYPVLAILALMAGSNFVIWLSYKNKEYGVGGMSFVVLINLIDSLRSTYGRFILYWWNESGALRFVLIVFGVALICVGIILWTLCAEMAEVRYPINHVMIHNENASRDYLAIKFEPVGTMPLMYCMSFYVLPLMILQLLSKVSPNNLWILRLTQYFNLEKVAGILCFMLVLLFTSISLSFVMLDTEKLSKRLQKSGDYLTGYRPGTETKKALKTTVFRLSFISGLMMALLSGLPLLARNFIESSMQLGLPQDIFRLPMSLMILVGVFRQLLEEVKMLNVFDRYRKED